MPHNFAAAALGAAVLLLSSPAHADQGVSKSEITLGTIQDLSGPIAAFGKQARLGMQLRVDEINQQGGIFGRKVRLLVEDSAYDPKRAVLAAQKLVNQDKIFAMVGHIGTAQNLAAMMLAHPYLDDSAPNVSFWAKKYKTQFNEDPSVLSAYGYTIMDAFITAAQEAGSDLSTTSFINAMEATTIPADIFGGPELKFGPNKHLGSAASRLSQLIDGRWRVVGDYQ
jgi:ABC-type branched-subunit amino acid transport system substrate-binding protein